MLHSAKPCPAMNARLRWSQILTLVGCLAMLLGGLDPLEGSPAILLGSALSALAAWIGRDDRVVLRWRCLVLGLVGCGVAALWWMSALGGVGGSTGRSMMWAALVLPLLVGWSMSFWMRGAPHWYTYAGIAAGVFYLVIPLLVVAKPGSRPIIPAVLLAVGMFGLWNVGACVWRLWIKDRTEPCPPATV